MEKQRKIQRSLIHPQVSTVGWEGAEHKASGEDWKKLDDILGGTQHTRSGEK
jgi:hypothetical protein